VVADYAESPSEAAFERMFERDKESLRELGIPVETVSLDAVHDDEWGYRIEKGDYQLPPVSFTTDELVALDVAARAWTRSALEGAATDAVRKLESTGVELPTGGSMPVETRISVTEDAFGPLMRAVTERRTATFTYRKPGAAPDLRRIEPWGLVLRLGATYVVGHDLDRDARRVFRVSRIEGDVSLGRPNDFERPYGIDLRAAVSDGLPETVSGTARLRVAPGRAMALRQVAGSGPDVEILEVPFRSLDQLERQVAGYGIDVVVLEPYELRDAVIRRLQGTVTP
jgi:proteasome accessory factor B